MNVILTGSTGFVGEGVLLASLEHAAVTKVLSLSRRPSVISHPKLREMLVPDFLKLAVSDELLGYDACFYCAGISSAGMKEAAYSVITYDTALHVAKVLLEANPQLVMNHVSGSHTDGSEQGRVMWARVKGRAENALIKLPFKGVYNYRPGLMLPMPGQTRVKGLYRVATVVMRPFFPAVSLRELAAAMIHATERGAPKQVLEIPDIKALAA